MDDDLRYHCDELAIALDPSHPRHCLPLLPGGARRILDLGCGMGQSLMGLRLPPEVEAWGVDRDFSAVRTGNGLAHANVFFAVGRGESLPFPDQYFDFVFSRVALPYMDVRATLGEVHRILKPKGRFWATLHPPKMLASRARQDLANGNVKDLGFCGFVALNSLLLHFFGVQLRLRGSSETVQTRQGAAKLLRGSGFRVLTVEMTPYQFIAQAEKRCR